MECFESAVPAIFLSYAPTFFPKKSKIKILFNKNELFYKGNSWVIFWFCFFLKGGAHAPETPPPPGYGLGT